MSERKQQKQMDISTTEIQASRDLLTRHLLLVAEAEEKGWVNVADKANLLWSDHESGITRLEQELEARCQ
jgi:hypothetical protein